MVDLIIMDITDIMVDLIIMDITTIIIMDITTIITDASSYLGDIESAEGGAAEFLP